MKALAASGALFVMLAACSPAPSDSSAPTMNEPQSSRFSGHLVWGHEVRSFTVCVGDREGWVINEAGAELVEVYEELTSSPYQEMFVEVRGEWSEAPQDGFGADFPETLRITELIRAEREGFGCGLDINGVLFVANGNEPFWRLHIRSDGMSMSSMDSPGQRKFPPGEMDEEGTLVTFNVSDPDAAIQVVLEKQRCADSMSGSRYQYVATVDIDGRRLSGCALEGL